MKPKLMRDVLIDCIYKRMHNDEKVIFLSTDLGALALDRLRAKFPDRFFNVGIAEQNAVNVATGWALEGFEVYVYNIAAFITMRSYEQIRSNLSIMAQTKPLNVNLIGIGAGLSYNVSGPTHHCLEDLTLMRLLPNIITFVPSDCTLLEKFVETTIAVKQPKYLRLEGKPIKQIYKKGDDINVNNGFSVLRQGEKVCIVATGYMTHEALKISDRFFEKNVNIGVIDIFTLKPINEDSLFNVLKNYSKILTLEEGFINAGGIDSLVTGIWESRVGGILRKGFDDRHIFSMGDRKSLHRQQNIEDKQIVGTIENLL